MKILVVGSGGREHALAWRLRGGDAPLPGREVIVCPGNAGIARELRCVPPRGEGNAGIVALAKAEQVDLVVIGPEAYLVDGLTDALVAAGIATFGPSEKAARLEGSKAFMKDVCAAAGVATAPFLATDDLDQAQAFIDARAKAGRGVVVKADGLCAGKGVIVCPRAEDAVAAARELLGADDAPPKFGDASRTIVLEDLLPGEELSVFALCDGDDAILFGAARDHKRLGEGDTGPNTGGMGAVAPLDEAQGLPAGMLATLRETIFLPVLAEMRRRGCPFRGVLFAGLMLDGDAVGVLEFNVRFGDPETEALMMVTTGDLAALLRAQSGAPDAVGIPQAAPLFAGERAAAVVVAAEGYPRAPVSGALIEGLEEASAVEGVKVFCAGVGAAGERLVVAGGRVLVVTGRGATFAAALDRAYAAVDKLRIAGAQLRRDIGQSVR